MARWQESPRIGNSVWTMNEGNGEVINIDYENGLILCYFSYKKITRTIEKEEFFGCLDERLNQWVLNTEV